MKSNVDLKETTKNFQENNNFIVFSDENLERSNAFSVISDLNKNASPKDIISKPEISFQEKNSIVIKKGDIFYANLSPVIGSEQGGIRPAIVIQNNVGNKFSPTVIVAAITSHNKGKLPTHILIKPEDIPGLPKNSVVLLEQIRTLDKKRLLSKICSINSKTMESIDKALLVSLGLTQFLINNTYLNKE